MKIVGMEWSARRCFGISPASRGVNIILYCLSPPERRALGGNTGKPGRILTISRQSITSDSL